MVGNIINGPVKKNFTVNMLVGGDRAQTTKIIGVISTRIICLARILLLASIKIKTEI